MFDPRLAQARAQLRGIFAHGEGDIRMEPSAGSLRSELSACLGWGGSFRHALATWFVRLCPLWREARQLAHHLAWEVLPRARERGVDNLVLEVAADGTVRFEAAGEAMQRRYAHIGKLACLLDLFRIDLSSRLEAEQIRQVLTLLWTYRRELHEAQHGAVPHGVPGRLLTESGVSVACTRTSLRAGTLKIDYSYSATRFSHAVPLFDPHHPKFRDHRVLFRAAPRFALLAGLVALIPYIITKFFGTGWVLASVAVLGAATLTVLTHVFFMIVGRVEYDNEEKAHRLARANQDLQRHTMRTQEDLARARSVQERLLPDMTDMTMSGRLDWGGLFKPQAEVGGDYFDLAQLDEDRVAILFCDVSGHGMAAALMTVIVKTAFAAWVDDGGDMPGFLGRLNRHLCQLTPQEDYAAIFLAVYHVPSGELTYLNCGHHPEPWVIPASRQAPIRALSSARATVLGFDPDLTFQPGRCRLLPGDTLLFLTDGLTEARNLRGEIFGSEQMDELLERNRTAEIPDLLAAIDREVACFAHQAPQTDDRTALAMRVCTVQ
ncbi:MAG: Phosphoserine phosphatase RsbP [Planctomycetes bacterium ADurb.Bin126]|nr:MAG: Phosphoserine phosphatase RsbP [Planctomycetes bacterium ADurb.Bin126]HOD81622.1 PP2C family protein-serine/threonine phosphatase [Phycisphaerae bacterium]HQL71944.1 PP2C family protein-serine/threonine phosphatase [Phycisphaerae bacterium]